MKRAAMGCGLAIAIGCGGSTTGSDLLSGHGGATSAVGGAAGTSNAGGNTAGGAAGTGVVAGAGGAEMAGASGASAGTGGTVAGTGGASGAGGTGGASAGNGGTAGVGGTGTAGTPGAGGSGPKDCAMLLADLKTYLAIAQTCSLSVSSVQCHDTVPGLCCQHIVTNKDSSETQSYLAALANFKAKCPGAPCPGTPCKTTMPEMCKEASPGSVAGACPDAQIAP